MKDRQEELQEENRQMKKANTGLHSRYRYALAVIGSLLFGGSFALYNYIRDGFTQNVVANIASSLLIAVASIVFLTAIEDIEEDYRENKLASAVAKKVVADFGTLHEGGVQRVFENGTASCRGFSEAFRSLLANSRESIKLQLTWYLVTDDLAKWITQALDEKKSRRRRGKRLTIQILVLDPRCSSAKLRAEDVIHLEVPANPDKSSPKPIKINKNGSELENTVSQMVTRMGNIHKLRADLRVYEAVATVDVRFYNSLPSMQMFIVDNEAIICPYWHGVPTRNAIHFHIRLRNGNSDTYIGKQIIKEFEGLWKSTEGCNFPEDLITANEIRQAWEALGSAGVVAYKHGTVQKATSNEPQSGE